MLHRLAWLQLPRARRWLIAAVLLPLVSSCQGRSPTHGVTPCRDGSQRCAAAAAPAGSRAFFRGSRPVDTVLVPRRNRESGAADIGGRSRWESFSETR
jgi:hypothetical protein